MEACVSVLTFVHLTIVLNESQYYNRNFVPLLEVIWFSISLFLPTNNCINFYDNTGIRCIGYTIKTMVN